MIQQIQNHDGQKSLFQAHVRNQHVHFMMSLIRHSSTRVTCSLSPKIHLWENKPNHNWFMYCFLEVEQELEHLFVVFFFPLACVRMSLQTPTLSVFIRAHVYWVRYSMFHCVGNSRLI